MSISTAFRHHSRSALLIVIAILVMASVSHSRLGKNVIPTHESIHLWINSDTTHYTGSVKIDLKVEIASASFQLHAEEMELTKVMLSNQDGSIDITYDISKKGLTTITPSSELSPGDYTLEIEFSNDFNTDAVGLYRVIENENGYLFTQFEENDAREAFPCFDEPEFKIPFDLILTVPDRHVAVANTPIVKETVTDGWRTVVFDRTMPLPTYLVAISTGLLESVEIEGMGFPGKVITVQGKKYLTSLAIKMTPPIIKAMEDFFGRPYPYKKLDLIAVPEFWAGAMENAGLITFRETALAIDEKTATASSKRRMASIISHEVAHMWFGDLVTMEWWDDLWLNEAFASWLGNKIVDQVFPEYNMDLSVIRSSQSVMTSDARQSTSPIKQETQDEDNLLQNIGIIYSKGEAVLAMYENWLGEEFFRDGIRQYINENEWGNATASDLWTALSSASGRDINTSMASFIIQPGVPLVTIEPGKAGEITISQKRMSNYGVEFPDAPLWQIPITFKYDAGGTIQTYSLLLTEQSKTVRLPGEMQPKWIMPNADMAGYYRWNAPPAMLKEMAQNSVTNLTAAERIGFLSNMSGLLNAGLLSAGDYLNILLQFAKDEDPEIIKGVMSGLRNIQFKFVNDDNRSVFASLIRQTLQPMVDKIGLTKKDEEPEVISMMRPSLLSFVADEGQDENIVKFANEQAKLYLKDPTSVDRSLVSTYLYLSAQKGDQALYDDFRNRFENAKQPIDRRLFLSLLGDFHDKKIIDQALEYTMNGPLRAQERGSIPGSISAHSPQMADFIFDWILEHYDEIASKIPPPSRAYLAYYMSGCSKTRLDKGLEFFSMPEHISPGLDSRIARITESVEDCISLKEREGASVQEFLDKFAGSK